MTSVQARPQRSYEIRRYNPDELPAVLDLMRAALGESDILKRSEELWNWKHRDNWFGTSHVLVATSESNEIVGLRAFLRWRFVRDGQPLTAVRAVDTSTHPDYQRMGMFSKLTLQALENVRNEGTDLVFNTPNDKSRPGYLKMGWKMAGQIRPLVKIRNYPKFGLGLALHKIRRSNDESRIHDPGDFVRAGGFRPARALLSNDSLTDLIEADAQRWDGYIRTDRSPGFLDWRYGEHPTIPYGTASIERNGKLAAAAIFRTNSRFGMREIVLSEVLLVEPDPRLLKELLSEVSAVTRSEYLITFAEPGAVQSQLLAKSGFRRLPFGAMTLTYNPLSAQAPVETGISDWGVGMGDLEFF